MNASMNKAPKINTPTLEDKIASMNTHITAEYDAAHLDLIEKNKKGFKEAFELDNFEAVKYLKQAELKELTKDTSADKKKVTQLEKEIEELTSLIKLRDAEIARLTKEAESDIGKKNRENLKIVKSGKAARSKEYFIGGKEREKEVLDMARLLYTRELTSEFGVDAKTLEKKKLGQLKKMVEARREAEAAAKGPVVDPGKEPVVVVEKTELEKKKERLDVLEGEVEALMNKTPASKEEAEAIKKSLEEKIAEIKKLSLEIAALEPTSIPETPPVVPTPEAVLAKPNTTEKDTIAKKLGPVGILYEDLVREVPSFGNLSYGQQLLAIDNFQQRIMRKTVDDAQARYDSEQGKRQWYNPVKWWKGMMKDYYVAGYENDAMKKNQNLATGDKQQILAELSKQISSVGYEVMGKPDGTYTITYAKSPEGAPENVKRAYDSLNTAATLFTKIPKEWSYEEATPEQQGAYKLAKAQYESARTELTKTLAEKSGDGKAFIESAQIDAKIWGMQAIRIHENTDGEMNRIVKENSQFYYKFKQWLPTFEKMGQFGLGSATRWASAGFLGWVAAPIAAAVWGGYRGGKRAEENIKNLNKKMRHGFKTETQELLGLLRNAKSQPERNAIIAKLESKKTGTLRDLERMQTNARLAYEKNKSKENEERLNEAKKLLEMYRTGNWGTLNTMTTKWFSENDVRDRTMIEADTWVKNLEKELVKLEKEENPDKRDKLVTRLATRVQYIDGALTNGNINFGSGNAEIANLTNLTLLMNRARLHTTLEKDTPTAKAFRTRYSAVMARINQTSEADEERRGAYIWQQRIKGAVIAAAVAGAGAYARHLWEINHPEDTTGGGEGGEDGRKIPPVVPPTPEENELVYKNFSVDFSSRGSIQTWLEAKQELGQLYAGVPKEDIPESYQHILNTNATDLAKEFGHFKPDQVNESLMILKGSTLEFKDGNIISHSIRNINGVSENSTLMVNNPGTSPTVIPEVNERYFDYQGNGHHGEGNIIPEKPNTGETVIVAEKPGPVGGEGIIEGEKPSPAGIGESKPNAHDVLGRIRGSGGEIKEAPGNEEVPAPSSETSNGDDYYYDPSKDGKLPQEQQHQGNGGNYHPNDYWHSPFRGTNIGGPKPEYYGAGGEPMIPVNKTPGYLYGYKMPTGPGSMNDMFTSNNPGINLNASYQFGGDRYFLASHQGDPAFEIFQFADHLYRQTGILPYPGESYASYFARVKVITHW